MNALSAALRLPAWYTRERYGTAPAPLSAAELRLLASQQEEASLTASTVSANRLHSACELIDQLRQYSPAELEIASQLLQWQSNAWIYRHDATGLAYLNGAVLAFAVAQGFLQPLATPERYRNDDRIQAIGAALDVTL